MTGQDFPTPDEFEPAANGNGSLRPDFEAPSEPVSRRADAAQQADDPLTAGAGGSSTDEYEWPSLDTGMGRNGRPDAESGGRRRNSRLRPVRKPGSGRPNTRPARQNASLSPVTRPAVHSPGESLATLSQEYELMVALAAMAIRTRKASAAGQLAAAMVPSAMQSVSRYRAELQPVLPVLIWGAASVAELMHAEGTSNLIELMPAILNQTAQRLGSLVALGQPVDRQLAADVLAEFTSLIIDHTYGSDGDAQRAAQAQWDGEGEDAYDSR